MMNELPREDFDIWWNTVLDCIESAGVTPPCLDADCFKPAYRAGRCAYDVASEYVDDLLNP